MSKELVIGSNRHETKVAILEEDQLVEVYFQRGNEYSLAGSIHKGRVTRVLPGMQSAFVDLGLERDTFLYVSDFFEEHDDIDTVTDTKPTPNRGGGGERRENNERRDRSNFRPQGERTIAPALQEPLEQGGPERDFEPVEPVGVSGEGEIPAPIGLEADNGSQASVPSEGDRNARTGDRGGDRRGRRSRRRRQKGRGFPETKYAQPSSGVETSAPASTRDEVEEDEAEPADVIVLPGESLAKYRRSEPREHPVAPSSERSQFVQSPEGGADAEVDPADTEAVDRDAIDPEALDEELEAEAEEIELSDRVFAHRDNNSVEAEEEKLAEVRHDEPNSPFIVPDLDTDEADEEPTATAAHHIDERGGHEAPSTLLREPVAFEPSTSGVVTPHPFAEPGSESNAPAHASAADVDTEEGEDEFPGEVPSGETLIYIEEADLVFQPADESAVEEEGADLEDGLAAEQPSEADENGGSEQAAGNQPQVQSATVRDPGERYPHRAPRRMRRRRGGSRFGGSASATAAANAAADSGSTANVLGTAAAPVFQPEMRREPVIATPPSADKPERVMPSISELLKPGQEIIVQIAKEPLGQKGARITSHIALPGRYVVFMPSVEHLGVSRKVASDEERQRLKRILQTHRVGTTGGFIVRTAGEGVPEPEIAADMNFLYTLWLDIRQKAEKKPAPALLHYDLDVVQRILRDQVTEDFKAIWVDNEDLYENVLSFMQRFQPTLVNRVKMYTRPAPIFDAFNITQELEKALRPKVWLKSGGYIVINQTEALVAIDINTGKFVGKSNRLEDTIVKTNTEAVKEIVRQIRLRDLGGIIVVDFIDMDERKNRQKVMQALEEAMRSDRAPYKILQFNDFGLVAITRKRVKQSLERTLCAPCPYCEGAGYIKSVQTVISEILIEAQKIARAIEGNDVVLRVNPEVAKVLKSSENKYLEELEGILGRPVLVKGDATLHQEKFDLG